MALQHFFKKSRLKKASHLNINKVQMYPAFAYYIIILGFSLLLNLDLAFAWLKWRCIISLKKRSSRNFPF